LTLSVLRIVRFSVSERETGLVFYRYEIETRIFFRSCRADS
jgi:hypothetical protein